LDCLALHTLIVFTEGVSIIAGPAEEAISIEILAVGISLLAIALLVKEVPLRTLHAPSTREIHLIAVGHGRLRPTDHARPVANLIPREAREACTSGCAESLASRIYTLALAVSIKEETIRALRTERPVERIAIGVEAVADDPRQAGVLDQSEPRIARQAPARHHVVCIAVGIDWLADLPRIQVVPRRAGSTCSPRVVGPAS
jgi:hypothetical protein